MSFERARQTLQLPARYTTQQLKAAYRRAVRKAPPDRDPEAFRQVRSAYEVLSNPLRGEQSWLLSPYPHVAPPQPTVRPDACREHGSGRNVSPRLSHADGWDAGAPTQGHGGRLAQAALRALLQSQALEEYLPEEQLDCVIEDENTERRA